MHLIRGLQATRKESGQVLVFFALWLPVILLFVGFAIDFGFGFMTKLRLAKAADATALAVMRNLGRGQTSATAMGQSVFALNISGNSNLPYVTAPSASITFSTSAGEPVVNVAATATIRTFFIWLAGIHTLAVADTSQATRPPVLLSLVLDRSGSMGGNGGGTALPGSVTDFLGYFIQNTDQVGETSFASNATIDVPITATFLTPITNSMSAMQFSGATYAQGGLLNAQAMISGVTNPPANTQKVVVYFTDGWANTNQDTLHCSPDLKVNYGGYDAPATGWAFLNPTTGTQYPSSFCTAATTFPTIDPALSNPATLSRANITTEGEYRAITLANQMRAQGMTVYSIGLGNDIDTTYLQEVANDPASPTYNPNQPSGLAEFAPTSTDLDTAFQTIASKILLRITQ